MPLLVFWLFLSVLVGVFASGKGRSGLGFFMLALLLSPVIGGIVVVIVKPHAKVVEEKALSAGDLKKCPFCAELVKAEAIVCKHCGRDLPAATAQSVSGVVVDEGF